MSPRNTKTRPTRAADAANSPRMTSLWCTTRRNDTGLAEQEGNPAVMLADAMQYV